jgi:hypothetical protein
MRSLRPIPVQYANCEVTSFRLSFFDQYGDECPATGSLSVSRKAQQDHARVGKGTGLYGLDATGKPSELSVGEAASETAGDGLQNRS